MFLEANASFSRRTNNQVWPYSADKDWASEVGFTGGTQNPISRGLPQFEATGFIILGPPYDVPKIWAYNNYQYAGNLTWMKSRHTFKMGGDFLRMQYFSRNYGDTRGRLVFNGRFSGYSMADMMLGWASSSRRQLDASGPYHLVSNYSGFVQDDWRVSPSLTLNIGLRYELMKPPREKYDALAMFMPSLGKVVIAGTGTLSRQEFDRRIATLGAQNVLMATDAGLPPSIVKTNYDLIAPRFGFAWRPFGNTRSVVRGGYGSFYGASSLYRMDEYNDTFPFSITETFSVSSANPTLVTASNPFPENRRGISGVTSSYGQESTQPKAQYLQSWNLTVEREFWSGTVLEVAYAGSKGTHLQRRYDVNQPFREQALSTVRPFSAFGSINIISDGSNSIYNSGSLTVRKRLARKVFVRAAYTYSKSLDESSRKFQYRRHDSVQLRQRAGSAEPETRTGPVRLRHGPHLHRQLCLDSRFLPAANLERLATGRHRDSLFGSALHAEDGFV
jgi:outer membrane receptor protein involved in Fe transport